VADHAKLAVLIDADNAQPGLAEGLLAEVARYGTAHVKRAYGDWTSSHLLGWKNQLLTQSIQPIQQFAYTTGKNATDSAMIIDAMDLLYTGRFDGFCIVSSDSDFTRLAIRIQESGLTVYGFGERKTPSPFVKACNKFIYTDVLDEAKGDEEKPNRPVERKSTQELRRDTRLVNVLRKTIEDAADDTGWAGLAAVGSMVSKQAPEFDPRNWGYGKLSGLVGAIGLFQTEERQLGNGKHLYVRNKKKPASRE
jgi:uncharacterized LabA/DUF88 family protein